MANNVDLGQIYGLNCPPGGCIGTTASLNPNIPTLEQIASYNLANPPQPVYNAGVNISELPNFFQSRNPDVNSTPATMLTTISSNQSGQSSMDQASNQTTQANSQMTRNPNSQTAMNQPAVMNQPNEQSNMPMRTQSAQSPTNGVTNSQNVPMTQAQIDEEEPGMLAPIPNYNQPFPVTAESIQYLNSFMLTQIGRRVKVEFLIGGGSLVERNGYLLAVGANFILLNEAGTNDILSCDFYNIKFVTFYY